jgi:hypothetical protein
MKKKILLIISFILLAIFAFNFISDDFNNQRFYKRLLPAELKYFLKKTLFAKSLENQKLRDKIIVLESEKKELQKKHYSLILKLRKEILNKKNIFFEFEDTKIIKSKKKNEYQITTFITDDLFIGKNPARNPKVTAYIDLYENKLFLVSGDGIISFIENYNDLNKQTLDFKIRESNFDSLVYKYDLYSSTYMGVKDVKIFQNKIYLSYSDRLFDNNKCHILSVARADLSEQFLNFENIFSGKECGIRSDAKQLSGLYSQGGRMQFNQDFLYLTIGTFGSELQAQNKNNYLGKVVRINLNDKIYKKIKIISMGHRNPQGMVLDNDNQYLYITEHGPKGGDEINFINLKNISEPLNFGWPISSYGEHVVGGKTPEEIKDMYKTMPLHKNHNKYNFIEPVYYFKNSAAISQIIKVDSNQQHLDNLYVGTLGRKNNENQHELHNFKINRKTKKVTHHDRIKINNRIRDLDYDNKSGTMIMFLETKGQIAFVKKK